MINATICFFFYYLILVFLMSTFDVKRYDGTYLSCNRCPPSSEIYCIWWISTKKYSVPANRWGFKILLELARKIFFEQKYIFFVIIRFRKNFWSWTTFLGPTWKKNLFMIQQLGKNNSPNWPPNYFFWQKLQFCYFLK